MEEIKVGEYVRTKSGKIRKLKSTVAQYYILEKVRFNDEVQYELKDFTKHSSNIIDLIECKDFVNGHLVIAVDREKGEVVIENMDWDVGYEHLKENEIKSIVTHEQFNSIKYEVI